MESAAGRSVERTTPKDIFLSEVKTRDVFPLLVLAHREGGACVRERHHGADT